MADRACSEYLSAEYSSAAFPLTPALSLREREDSLQRWEISGVTFANALPRILPLPEGEGSGEREQDAPRLGSFVIETDRSNSLLC